MGVGDTSIRSSERPETGSVNIPLGIFPASSTNESVDANRVADKVVACFNDALSRKDHAAIASLFCKDNSYWRDHLALAWELRTVKGSSSIKQYLDSSKVQLTKLEVSTSSEFRAPKFGAIDVLGDIKGINFFIELETTVGRGEGVMNLAEENGEWKIFTIYTLLKELKGHEEPLGHRRTKGVKHGGDPDRKTWKETRDAEKEGIDPRVLILGAGQGGLTVAARLKMLGVPALMIDQNKRVGDNWRKRYRQLVLHDPVWYDHMPYVPFPAHWPVFTPKDKLAEFFEAYVNLLELNVWNSTSITSTSWDESKRQWTVTVEHRKSDGSSEIRTVHPRHIVQATGHSGEKNFPKMKGMETFKGDRLCHSSEHPGANPESRGKKAVVVGCCNSGHDIAQDFFEKGYDVTIVQRSTTCVVSSEAITDIGNKGLYDQDSPPVDDADLTFWGLPSELLKTQQIKVAQISAEHDKKTLDGLRAVGFGIDRGPMDSGLLIKYFQRGGGYYIDVGASQLIIDGKIRVKQGQEISQILPNGIEFADGHKLEADEIVFATGYQNMRTQARKIFGDEVADRVNDVWGFNDEGEFRTMWQKSGHPGLWFMGGNLALSRYFSRILALQIKGIEEGIAGTDAEAFGLIDSTVKLEFSKQQRERLRIVEGDVTVDEDRELAVQTCFNVFGGLDTLIYCAGVITPIQRLEKLDVEAVKRSFDVNVFGAMNMVQLVLPHLRASRASHPHNCGRGKVIILSSACDSTVSYHGWMPYSTAKAALTRFVSCLAHEEPLLSVQGVYPKLTRTKMIDGLVEGKYKNIMADHEIERFRIWDDVGDEMVEPPELCGEAVAKLALGLFEGGKSGETLYYDEHVPRKIAGT
ncbi:flavin-binding monooxygenase-like protein [Stemphylium lycopersici]|uniref:FAD/NAD(P)-binding domain-containing protein n=1 Tax=Stemphylium lycopersici TaxID=183478 RepID=A0A364N0T9_STELY|nr:flavin-binding monooxygenase-like protein [Stemphylium lycopersici]RAR08246.1 FAD/NAD(P)-binding domain-containing protein [Stemphylium lycopersici]